MTEKQHIIPQVRRIARRFWLPILLVLALLAFAAGYFFPRPVPPAPAPDPAVSRTLNRLATVMADIRQDEVRLIGLRQSPDAVLRAAEVQALEALLETRRETAAQLWQDLGALMELVPPHPDASALVRFPSEPVERHNYSQIYHPIEGPQPYKMPDGFAFRFDRIVPQPDGSLLHRLDANSGGAIKWERELSRLRTEGHYTVEATINGMHPGVVYAPLWLYSEGSSEGGHEFDFELMQGRIEYNLHNGNGGFNMRKVEKDVSGHRMRFEIIRRPMEVTMRATSLTDGWSDELVVTPAQVAEWAKQDGAPRELRFPPGHVAMFPVTELWRCRWPEWCGEWQPPASGETIEMVIHGYRVEP
jgi:hypothetical protein